MNDTTFNEKSFFPDTNYIDKFMMKLRCALLEFINFQNKLVILLLCSNQKSY
jgi:hypothetical protein